MCIVKVLWLFAHGCQDLVWPFYVSLKIQPVKPRISAVWRFRKHRIDLEAFSDKFYLSHVCPDEAQV